MKKKINILFVLPSLETGGAERVIVNLINYIGCEYYSVHLALFSKTGSYLSLLPSGIVLHDLKTVRTIKSIYPLLRLIWNERPDVVFATHGHVNIILLAIRRLLPTNTKLIVREANSASVAIQNYSYSQIWVWLYKKYYPCADLIICQSEYMLKDLAENFAVPKNRLIKIYNPVDTEYIRNKTSHVKFSPYISRGNGPHLLCVGRLTHQKGIDVLIKMIPIWREQHPDIQLWIIGDGEKKQSFEELAKSLGISESVHFLGYQENPYIWMKYADLYILPSRWEGLPNALLEALACNSPIMVLNHPGGTEEILEKCNLTRFLYEKLPAILPTDSINTNLPSEFEAGIVNEKYSSAIRSVLSSHKL